MKIRARFIEPFHPTTTGYSKEGGQFWVGFAEEEDTLEMIMINLTVWSDDSPDKDTFAHLEAHHDGIRVLQELAQVGFLQMFHDIKATTFYDVAQCFERCGIPITYLGKDVKEMSSRKMYDKLHATN